MLDLLIIMLERVGIIIAVAFILTRFRFFKDLIAHDQLNGKQVISAILFFGFFGIIGTYLGVALNPSALGFGNVMSGLNNNEAIANMRVMGVVMAGLLGGYRIGIGAGLIAGVHRMLLGGFTSMTCGVSTIIAGIISGACYKKGKKMKPFHVFLISASLEALQMVIILIFSKPFEKAYALVEVIGIPMIFANGAGAAIFMLIIYSVIDNREKIVSQQAQKTLRIADQTLIYFREGITVNTAHAVCNILYKELHPSAVAITNQTEVLAHIGVGSDHHRTGTNIQTEETKRVIQTGEMVMIKNDPVHCEVKDCPLKTAIITPLKQRNQTIGTLKLFVANEKQLSDSLIETMNGISKLLSNQLEIAEAERAHQLAQDAEIKALQANINPHFLFNSLNIIMSLIRTRPEEARGLLRNLSYFLRQNVTKTHDTQITLDNELNYVKAYLSIIEARFVDRLSVQYDVDESVLKEMVPPFTLQPLVENAIQHGIVEMGEDCLIKITIRDQGNHMKIEVEDNGIGISDDKLASLGKQQVTSEHGTGMGLYNVNRRLTMMYGDQAALQITSHINEGTKISFQLKKYQEDVS